MAPLYYAKFNSPSVRCLDLEEQYVIVPARCADRAAVITMPFDPLVCVWFLLLGLSRNSEETG